MQDSELWKWDAVDLAKAIKARQVSSHEAVEACLQRLDDVNSAINAVTVVLADEALAAADAADRIARSGAPSGLLHGVPVIIKENTDQEGTATTSGVAAFKDLVAETDSPPVANLRREGAIILGRTNTSPFAMRWHTDNALRGATLNPWSREHTPGGSSGGAAASVAVGIAPIGHGSDYGGSIRWPAYCCGLAGIRPTLGRVAAFNGTATSERTLTGQIFSAHGLLARKVRDVRLGLAAISSRDVRDPWWVPAPLVNAAPENPIRVALTVDPSGQGVAPEVAEAVKCAGMALEDAGYAVEEVEPPSVHEAMELWWRLAWTEVKHAMGPAIRKYGDSGINQTLDLYLSATPVLDLPTYINDVSRRATLVRQWLLFLERFPLIVGPVSSELPFLTDFETGPNATAERQKVAFRLLAAVNLLGLPAVAVPTGTSRGLPVGVQVIGSRYREDLCLGAAEAIEAQNGLDTPIDIVWQGESGAR